MKRRVRVQPDPERLVVLPESGEPMLFVRMEAGVGLEGAWAPGPEGSRPPGASIQLMPQGRLLCRTFELPDADAAQLETALRLQVEAQQMGSVPAWRTSSIVLPGGSGKGRLGVCVEWPAADAPTHVRRDLPPDGDPMHAGDVGCLATLLAQGLTGPLVCVSRELDALTFAFRAGGAAVVRCARLDPSMGPAGAEAAVLESALRAGLDEPGMRALLQKLRQAMSMAGAGGFGCTPDDLRALVQRTGGSPGPDPSWWNTKGLAVAAALGWFGAGRSMVSLRDQAPGERPSRLGEFLNRIADPALASRLLVAALVAIAVAPPLVTGARLLLLRWKVGDLAAREQAIQAHRQRVAMYGEMQRRTWPMGKLMGDLACVTPEGIDWQDVNLSQDRNVTVRGTARSQDGLSGTEVILKMERQMRDSRIFDKVTKKWDAPDAKGTVDFTISAVVAKPTLRPAFPVDQDFGKKTLAERRYGPEKPAEPEPAETSEPAAVSVAAPEPASVGEEPSTTAPVVPPPSAAPAVAAEEKHASNGKGSKKAGGVSTKPSNKPQGKSSGKSAAAKEGSPEAPAAPTDSVDAGGGDTGEASKGARGQRRGSPATAGGGLPRRSDRTPGSSDASFTPPPPLSDSDIEHMTREEALAAVSKVSEARQRVPADDTATKDRLKKEFDKLMAKIRSTAGGGGGGK